MKSIMSQNPCKTCNADSQKGNPYYWQTPCHDCQKKRAWELEKEARIETIEEVLGDDYDLDRLRELVEADRGGRCVVLPCKVGDKMQYIDGDESIGYEIVEKIVVEIETDGGIYSANELKPEDFKTPESSSAVLKGDQHG